MLWSTLFRLAFRNLLRHPWRSVATTLGVALGIAAVLATLSVGDNVEANVRSTLDAAAGRADLLVTPGAQGRSVFSVDDVLDEVASTPGVLRVHPVLNTRAEPVRDIQGAADSVIPGVDSGFQLSGRETEEPEDLPAELLAGALPDAGSQGVALASGFAQTRGYAVGDEIAFASRLGDLPFTVTGLLDDSIGLASTNGGRVGIANLNDLQDAFRLSGRASFIEVLIADGSVAAEVQERLEAAVGDAYTVTLPSGSGNLATGVVDTIQAGLRVLAATLIALGGFMAYNTFAAGVVERTQEYALLRTICMTRAQVQRLALVEAALVSLLGVVLGLTLGVLLSLGITQLQAQSLGFEFRTLVIPVGNVLLASVIGVLVSLLAGLLPARAASQTHPLAASRRTEERTSRNPHLGWPLVIGGVIAALSPWQGGWAIFGSALAMGLLFLGITLITPLLLPPALTLLRPIFTRVYGVAGKLGASFTLRNAERNAVAIGAVIVGMGLTIGVGAMVAGINQSIRDWVDTTIVGDLFVTTPVSFPAGFEQAAGERVSELAEISGVGVRVVRFEAEEGARGRSVALVLVDPERFNPEGGFGRFQFIDGQGDAQVAYDTLRSGGQVLAANTILDRFGVERGDEVQLRTNEGFQGFEVGGVVVDFTGGGEAFVGSLNDADLFGGGTPDLFVMTLQEGADPQAVRESLIGAFPELYLDVTLNQSYRERILTLTQQTFATTNGLLILAVFIAALGVANTLGMNLSSRQHEIAVLRTLGLTRRGVRRLISAEGVVIIVVGTLLGILCGVLLSTVITAGANALTGYRIVPVYPWRLIVVALVSSPLVGLLASLLPARRAAKLSPVTALGGE